MKVRSEVWVSFQFEGFHCWPDAPDVVGFLRDRHRHMFHVKAWKRVAHDDRDVEFILLRRQLVGAVARKLETFDGDGEATRNWSCEHWARWLIDGYALTRCEVSEDGENGAVLEVVQERPAPKLELVAVAPSHIVVRADDTFLCVCGLVFMDSEAASSHLRYVSEQ